MALDLTGVMVATVTPFTRGGAAVDHDWIPPHLRFLEQAGVSSVFTLGTNGEGPSVGVAERRQVVETVVAHQGGLGVVAGAGTAALPDTIRAANDALEAGADAVYVESPTSVQELKHIVRAFDALNMASMLEGGKTPIMKPADLHAMGYNIVIYGITLLMRITRTMQLALEDLRSERLELVGSGVSFEEYMRIVGLDRWSAIETRFDVEKTGPA